MSATPAVLRRLLLRSSSATSAQRLRPSSRRPFSNTHSSLAVKPFLLADIGEGITECQLIQWFVSPGARVEQFDKLCEVQSDKASVEITSPYDGVVKKLHYEPDDMAVTGRPLVDIDVDGDGGDGAEETVGGEAGKKKVVETDTGEGTTGDVKSHGTEQSWREDGQRRTKEHQSRNGDQSGRALATPAIRHLTRELQVDILEITGTGKDGRVLKEDVHRHVSRRDERASEGSRITATTASVSQDRKASLTPVQNQMFKAMTRSLQIPHFLYSCAADMTAITALRATLNAGAQSDQKITHLAFIMKAVSLAVGKHPILNASLNTKDDKKPELMYRASHNFGIAIDTPSGLLVPVIRDVQALSIIEIASRMRELSTAARHGKLAPNDFQGATFTVSNIGSVGGGVVAPVISEPQVAILGVGRSKIVPGFDERDNLVKKEELVLSWSADHRVVDGAECARCAERVKGLLEQPASMMAEMR